MRVERQNKREGKEMTATFFETNFIHLIIRRLTTTVRCETHKLN